MKRKRSSYWKLVEYRCKELLENMGGVVFRSAGSHGVADLIAVFPEKREIWLVQVKKGEMPKQRETLLRRFESLTVLCGVYTCKPMLYAKQKGRYCFVRVGGDSS